MMLTFSIDPQHYQDSYFFSIPEKDPITQDNREGIEIKKQTKIIKIVKHSSGEVENKSKNLWKT